MKGKQLFCRVLYISTHRYEHGNFWPHLAESDFDHIGEGDGQGFNVNIPLNKVRQNYF
jgi:histone deacetylase 6